VLSGDVMDVKDLSGLSIDELAEKEKQLRHELFNFRFQLGIGRLENPMQVRSYEARYCSAQNGQAPTGIAADTSRPTGW
jgi:ribosomal protein L29